MSETEESSLVLKSIVLIDIKELLVSNLSLLMTLFIVKFDISSA